MVGSGHFACSATPYLLIEMWATRGRYLMASLTCGYYNKLFSLTQTESSISRSHSSSSSSRLLQIMVSETEAEYSSSSNSSRWFLSLSGFSGSHGFPNTFGK